VKRSVFIVLSLVFFFSFFLLQGCDRSKLTTAVTSVIDGDSITVKALQGTVRLIGIDAPEVTSGSKPAGQFAEEAREFLKQMVLSNGKVTLELHGKDSYGRHLAYLFNSEGEFVNAELVRQGLARPLTYEDTSHNSAKIREAYRQAFNNRSGIFSSYNDFQVYDASEVREALYPYQLGGFLGKIVWVEFTVIDVNGFTVVGDDIVVRVRPEEATLFGQDSEDLQRLYRKKIRVFGEIWQDDSGKALILLRDPAIEITGISQFANSSPFFFQKLLEILPMRKQS
jgi:micrococcal nuclease